MANPFDQFDNAPAQPAAAANPFDQFDAPPPAAAPTDPSWSQMPGEAFVGGMKHVLQKGRQASQLATGQPIEETHEPDNATERLAAEPFEFGTMPDGRTLKKVAAKAGVGLVAGAPEMAGAIAGGTAGAGLSGGNPFAIAAGVGVGSGVVSAATSLAPFYAEELKKSGDPDAAWSDALKRATAEGAGTGLSFSLFEFAPFAGAVKNLLTKVIAQAPAGAAAQGFRNVATGAPITEGMGQAAGEGMANAAPILVAGHAVHSMLPKPFAEVKAEADKTAADIVDGKPLALDGPEDRLRLPPPDIKMGDRSGEDINAPTPEPAPAAPLALPAPGDPGNVVDRARYARRAADLGVDAVGPNTAEPTQFTMQNGEPAVHQPEPVNRSDPAQLPPPRRALPPPAEGVEGEGFKMFKPGEEGDPNGTPLERAVYGVTRLDPGSPITNSVLKNLTGAKDFAGIKVVRDDLVARGLVEKKGIQWRRAAEPVDEPPMKYEAPPAAAEPAKPEASAEPAAEPEAPAPKQPPRLIDFLAATGGLKDDTFTKRDATKRGRAEARANPSDLRSMGAHNVPKLVRPKVGKSLDDAALHAWENGYFPERSERPSINEFLDKLRSDLDGQPQYSKHDAADVQAYHDYLERDRGAGQQAEENTPIHETELPELQPILDRAKERGDPLTPDEAREVAAHVRDGMHIDDALDEVSERAALQRHEDEVASNPGEHDTPPRGEDDGHGFSDETRGADSARRPELAPEAGGRTGEAGAGRGDAAAREEASQHPRQEDRGDALKDDAEHLKADGQQPHEPSLATGVYDRMPGFMRYLKDTKGAGATPLDRLKAGYEWVKSRGAAFNREYLVAYDKATGLIVDAATSHLQSSVNMTSRLSERLRDPNSRVVVQHNHPSGRTLSASDIGMLARHGLDTVIAHGITGDFYAAKLTARTAAQLHDPNYALAPGSKLAKLAFVKGATGPALAKRVLLLAHGSAGKAVGDFLGPFALTKELPVDLGNYWAAEIIQRSLARAGITDYLSSLGEFPAAHADLFTKAQQRADIAATKLAIDAGLKREYRSVGELNRPARAVRPAEGLAEVLGSDAGTKGSAVGGGAGGDHAGANSAGAASRPSRKPEQLKLLDAAQGDRLEDSLREQTRAREEKYDPHVQAGLNKWNGPRDDRTVYQRIGDSIKGTTPGLYDRFYQQAVDRRFAFARNDRARIAAGHFAGNDITKDGDLHAAVSAHKAAMFYDREASFAERQMIDGHIAYDGNGTKVVGREQGLLNILDPIGKKGTWREFATYARITRAERLAGEIDPKTGRPAPRDKMFTPADRLVRAELERLHPELKKVHTDLQAYNKKMVQYLVDTGRIKQSLADEWTKNADYTPFYREKLLADGGSKIGGPLHVDSLTNDNSFRRLKGGDAQIGDYLENLTRNMRAITASGLKNVAAKRAIDNAVALGIAHPVKGTMTSMEHAPDIVRIYEHGEAKYYKVNDGLTLSALHGLDGAPMSGLMKFLGYPAHVLRTLTTHTPTFLLVNHPMRESMQAWLVSRENVAPIVSAIRGQIEVMRGSALTRDLQALGVGGGFDLAGGEGRAEKYVRQHYKGKDSTLAKIHGAWERLKDSADLGVRTQVYQKELAKLAPRAGNEYEAATAALRQGVNFKQRGASEALRYATIAIPFLNARIQGLDTLGRAFVNRPVQTAMKAMMMVGLASAYYAWVRDNPLYQQAAEEVKDQNFLIPVGDQMFRLGAPFEAGILFKTIPERLLRRMDGSDLSKDTKEAFGRAILHSLNFDPIPQAFKPALEVATNHSFFTGRSVVPDRLKEVAPSQQFTDKTSEAAKLVGKAGVSPMNVDQLLKGYFGSVGGYALAASDALIRAAKGGPERPDSKNWLAASPILGSLFKNSSNIGDAAQSRLYDLKHEVDEVVKTVNLMKKSDPKAAGEYQREHAQLLGVKGYTDNVGKQLSGLRTAEQQIKSSPALSGEAKRAQLDSIEQRRRQLLSTVEDVRRRAGQ